MPVYLAFLRAINVGGHIVKMDRLKALFEAVGFANVRTFIASGNVIFESPGTDTAALEKKIAASLEKSLGYAVDTFVRTPGEVEDIAGHAPFKPADIPAEGTVYIGLLTVAPDPKTKKTILAMATKVDGLHVHKREVYWLARKRFLGAEFTPARMEKTLGCKATFRNVNTFRRIADVAKGHATRNEGPGFSPASTGKPTRKGLAKARPFGTVERRVAQKPSPARGRAKP